MWLLETKLDLQTNLDDVLEVMQSKSYPQNQELVIRNSDVGGQDATF